MCVRALPGNYLSTSLPNLSGFEWHFPVAPDMRCMHWHTQRRTLFMHTQLQWEGVGSPFGTHTHAHTHAHPHKSSHALKSMTSLLGPSVAVLACFPSHQHDLFPLPSTIFTKSSSCGSSTPRLSLCQFSECQWKVLLSADISNYSLGLPKYGHTFNVWGQSRPWEASEAEHKGNISPTRFHSHVIRPSS